MQEFCHMNIITKLLLLLSTEFQTVDLLGYFKYFILKYFFSKSFKNFYDVFHFTFILYINYQYKNLE